jgi:hypothetical protein
MRVIIGFNDTIPSQHADKHTLQFENFCFLEPGPRQEICSLIKWYVVVANKGSGRIITNNENPSQYNKEKEIKSKLFKYNMPIHTSQISRDLRRKLIQGITYLLYPEQKDVFFFSHLYTTELTDSRFKSALTKLIMDGVYITLNYKA